MKMLALVLILAERSAGVIAQGAEVAGEALGAGTLLTINAALVSAGVLSAGAVAAGSKADTTTSH